MGIPTHCASEGKYTRAGAHYARDEPGAELHTVRSRHGRGDEARILRHHERIRHRQALRWKRHAWAAFAILPIYVSLEKIDRSLLEAATDLGDGPVKRFTGVTLPLSLPGIIAASLLIFIPTVGDFVTPALVGGPDGAMIANLIRVQFGRVNNWPMGAALSLAVMVIIAAISLLYIWTARRFTEYRR